MSTGSRSTFANSGEELQLLVDSIEVLVQKLKDDHARRRQQADPFNATDEYMVCNCLYKKINAINTCALIPYLFVDSADHLV